MKRDNQIDDVWVQEVLYQFLGIRFLFKALPMYSVLYLTSYLATVDDFFHHKEQFILLALINIYLVFGAFPKRLEERSVNDFV